HHDVLPDALVVGSDRREAHQLLVRQRGAGAADDDGFLSRVHRDGVELPGPRPRMAVAGAARRILGRGLADRVAADRERLAEVDGDDLLVQVGRRLLRGIGARVAIGDRAARVAGRIAVLAGAGPRLRPGREADARHVDDDLVALARTEALRDLRDVAA